MKDIFSGLGVISSLAPAVVSATTKGSHADLQGYNAALLVINTGAVVGDGLYDLKLQESDTTTDGDFGNVDAKDLIGSLPAELAATSAYKVGYVGNKRYIRAVITKTSGTSIVAGAVVIKGSPSLAPVA